MPIIVETCWGPKEIDEKPYWHIVSNSGWAGDIFKNNVRVGKGALLSVSAGIEREPEIENAHTQYSLFKIDCEKEKIFEEIRIREFPTSPSRLKTIYLFDAQSFAERALSEWFQNESKVIHKCHILTGSVIHKADTHWLNSLPAQWEEYARKYWSSEMSHNPFPEVLVHGALYFQDWKQWALE